MIVQYVRTCLKGWAPNPEGLIIHLLIQVTNTVCGFFFIIGSVCAKQMFRTGV